MANTARFAANHIRKSATTIWILKESCTPSVRSQLPAQSKFFNSAWRHRKFSTAHQVSPTASRPKKSSKDFEMASRSEFILTLSCPDRPGIVHAVTGFLAKHNLNIVDSQQFGDPSSKKFFMRVHFAPAVGSTADNIEDADQLRASFGDTAESLNMEFELSSIAQKPRVLIMVSKIGHCLNDLLFRHSTSQLNIDVPLIVSNHPDFAPLAASHKIPFHHLPVTADTKLEQESQILKLIKVHTIDLIVLARYMQVLSPGLCSAMSGKIINIHHSFLPSFKVSQLLTSGDCSS